MLTTIILSTYTTLLCRSVFRLSSNFSVNFQYILFDKVQLTLDRTNWKWGKRDINILMLAIVYRGIAIPIVWTLLNKRGNSDTKERIALIQRFISIFGKDRIVNVFADREFIGEKWFTWLIENDINFCIRVKKTSL